MSCSNARVNTKANAVLAGDIEDAHMSAGHQPNPAFGRRGRESGLQPARREPAPRPQYAVGRTLYLAGLAGLFLAVAGALVWTLSDVTTLKADAERADQKVIALVNQPVTHLPRTGPVSVFSPGWFHPGAITPDFDNVDVRATQEFPYDRYEHVTSDLNPGEMFIGSELEFNSMTKYFYADRTLPKKRLSEAEMTEINGLYRVIGRDEHVLFVHWWAITGLLIAGFGLGSALLLPIIARSR
jgi:hypothetical protein